MLTDTEIDQELDKLSNKCNDLLVKNEETKQILLSGMQKNLVVTVKDLTSVSNVFTTLQALNKKNLVNEEDLLYIQNLKERLEHLFF